jgi:hypothetical protein
LHLDWNVAESIITAPGKRAQLAAPSPAVEFLRAATSHEPARVVGTGSNFFPGFTSIYDLEGINGPDALQNRPYRELAEAANVLVAPGDWRFELPPSGLTDWSPFLNFLNVRYVAAPVEALPTPHGYVRLARNDFDVFRSENAWPRAYFVDRIETYTTASELMAMIRNRANDGPFAAVQRGQEMPALSAPPSDSNLAGFFAAQDYRLTTNTTEFTIVAPRPGLAVLQEAWLKDDFRATLDGKPVPYFRANHAFKAVVIPSAGMHRVSFRYWPRNLEWMLVISAIGLAAFVGLCFAVRILVVDRREPLE